MPGKIWFIRWFWLFNNKSSIFNWREICKRTRCSFIVTLTLLHFINRNAIRFLLLKQNTLQVVNKVFVVFLVFYYFQQGVWYPILLKRSQLKIKGTTIVRYYAMAFCNSVKLAFLIFIIIQNIFVIFGFEFKQSFLYNKSKDIIPV